MATKEVRNLQTLNKQAHKQKFDLDDTGYEPIETIGSGAYGIVCSAICKKTKDRVAIKKISLAFDHIDTWKSTYREIRILKHFNHENIISIREILKPKTDNFKDIQIVLDFMESDLHKIIHTQELTDEHIRYFLYQILRGLKYIHSANVIHRDLKPSNLLVNANCELKIGDFGMSRVAATSSREKHYSMTQYVATRWYRAPELIIPYGEYSFSVDLWSVGCILAEMIGQKVLFRGENPHQQYSLIVKKCGTPSKEYLEKYAGPYMQALMKTHHKPVEWPMEFPKAHRKSLDMLGKLLRIDPRDRIAAEVALKHPYLSKYHEPQDEPVCKNALGVDFEEKISATEQLRKLITEEIMSYHKPPNYGIPNLKPVPVEQVKQLTNKKHQSLLSESALPQLSPRTTGLASFLQLQRKLQNNKDDNAAFKKPFPAAIIGSNITPTDIDATSERTVVKDGVKKLAAQTESGASVGQDELLGAQTTTSENGSKSNQEQQDQQEPKDTIDDHQQPASAESASHTVSNESSEQLAKGIDTKQRIRDIILKSQAKPRPAALVDSKPKPVTAYQRRKEKERKREKMLAKRKSRSKDEKPDGEMSQMDVSILARWEQMQKEKKEKTSESDQISTESDQISTKSSTSKTTDHNNSKTEQSGTTSPESGPSKEMLQAINSAAMISTPSASSAGTNILMNMGGPVLSTGFNIIQNLYIPLLTNVPFIPAVNRGPIVYAPDGRGITPLSGHGQTYTYALPNHPAQPVVVVRDNVIFSQAGQQSTSGSHTALSSSLVNLQHNVNSNSLPFATYQTISQPTIVGAGLGAADVPNPLNTQGPKDTSVKDKHQTVQPDEPTQPELIHAKQDSEKRQNIQISLGDSEIADNTNVDSLKKRFKDFPQRIPVSISLTDKDSQHADTNQRLGWREHEECDTPPVNVPFSTSSESSLKRSAPESLDTLQDVKKMRINTSLQPSNSVIIITPTGKYAVTHLASANSDINSGMSESAPASGLKRDWQQAINMDPKELEEALRTVMQTDLPSPSFVSDVIDQKQ